MTSLNMNAVSSIRNRLYHRPLLRENSAISTYWVAKATSSLDALGIKREQADYLEFTIRVYECEATTLTIEALPFGWEPREKFSIKHFNTRNGIVQELITLDRFERLTPEVWHAKIAPLITTSLLIDLIAQTK